MTRDADTSKTKEVETCGLRLKSECDIEPVESFPGQSFTDEVFSLVQIDHVTDGVFLTALNARLLDVALEVPVALQHHRDPPLFVHVGHLLVSRDIGPSPGEKQLLPY